MGYVEAHGTGTPVGDPVEMRALAGALAFDRPAGDPLLIGSVKTNIGHLEAGAGVAGLIKAALVLEHGYMPANLHLAHPEHANPVRGVERRVPRTGRPFPAGGRRIAGVNSFGFGGTNAHVVLCEPPAPADEPAPDAPRHRAADPAARSRRAARRPSSRRPVAWPPTSAPTPTPRSPISGTPSADAARTSTTAAPSSSPASTTRGSSSPNWPRAQRPVSAGRLQPTAPKLAFVCTGMGPQWWRMCRGLLDEYPAFADSVARTDRELSRYADWSLLDELRRDEADSRMARTEVAQPANFAVQVALAEQLREFGIRPTRWSGTARARWRRTIWPVC